MFNLNWQRTMTVARTDLKKLAQSKDFWIPMAFLGFLFFVLIPGILLSAITVLGNVELVASVSETLDVLPAAAQAEVQGSSPEGRTGFTIAVFLICLLYTSPSPRDRTRSRMPSSA